MSQEFWALPRIAGGLLVASVLVVLAGLVVIALQGNGLGPVVLKSIGVPGWIRVILNLVQ